MMSRNIARKLLIKNGLIVTMNDKREVLPGDLLIDHNKVSQIGYDINGSDCAVFDAASYIIIPGLIQTHVHLCQTLFRNLADDLSLFDWLQQKIWPYESKHTPETLRTSAQLGILELLLSGTTTIMDFGTVHHMDVVFEELVRSGMRAFCGKTMMDSDDSPSGLRENTHQAIDSSLDLFDRWNGKGNGRIGYAFAPRFILSCTKKLLIEITKLCQEHQIPFHSHAAETQEEVNRVIALHNERCIGFFDRIGATDSNLCLAHCIWLNDHEIDLLREKKINVLHCPGSNLKLGSGIAPIPDYIKNGITVSLGTDGAPCNNNLDIFPEMRMAALIQKPRYGPEAMDAETVFNMVTRAGAETLNLQHEIGSIETGKCADLVFLRQQDLNSIPFDNIYSKLVYSTKASAVEHVMINGEWVVKNGTPVHYRIPDIIHDVQMHAKIF